MTILTSCCCWKSLKRGSFASGIFTLALYSIVLTAGAFNLQAVNHSLVLVGIAMVLIVFSGLNVFSSIILIIGLHVDNRRLLLPWLVVVTMTTVLDVIMAVYLLTEAQALDVTVSVFFGIDIFLCVLHVYCILCVASQYQKYIQSADLQNQSLQILESTFHHPLSSKVTSAPSSSQLLKISHNGSVSASSSSSNTTSKSFHPTDLSSISEEPSSYVPSDAGVPAEQSPSRMESAEVEGNKRKQEIWSTEKEECHL